MDDPQGSPERDAEDAYTDAYNDGFVDGEANASAQVGHHQTDATLSLGLIAASIALFALGWPVIGALLLVFTIMAS